MTLAELVSITRRALRDSVGADADRFWQDEDIEEYLNEAQEEMAKQTLCLIESLDDDVCTIALVANTHSYRRNSKIIQIDEIRPSWSTDPLIDGKSFRRFSIGWEVRKGLPSQYCCNFATGYLTLDQNPATVSGEKLHLTVRRMPRLMTTIAPPEIPDPDAPVSQDAEVPEEYQRHLRHYACYRALEVKDRQVENKAEADRALSRWNNAIEDIKTQLAQLQPDIHVSRSIF